MIDCAGQVLEVLDKEFLGIFCILRQWLHHTEHLTHIGFRPLKDTLQFIIVKLTTRLIQFTWSGQGSKLNDVLSFGFMMNVTCHPLKDPSLWIPVVASNVQCGIKLQQKLFVLVLFVSYKWQQPNVSEAVQSLLKAWQPSNSITIKTLIRKDVVLVV